MLSQKQKELGSIILPLREVNRAKLRKSPTQGDASVRLMYAQNAARDLRHMATMITPADFPGLASKIRSALKSAEGAVRNAQRFVDKEVHNA